jgi:hypothetical protein
MSDSIDVQKSVDRMKIHMELRGLRPNTVSTFARCARRFLAHTDKAPAEVTSTDVEGFLLDLVRKGRSPRTRNVNLAAVRCLLGATTGGNATAGIPRAKVPRRSPEILSGSEVALLLSATAWCTKTHRGNCRRIASSCAPEHSGFSAAPTATSREIAGGTAPVLTCPKTHDRSALTQCQPSPVSVRMATDFWIVRREFR